MNIVEKIQNLSEDTITQDENFLMLSEALSEYHRLIQEGKLIPRKNNIENKKSIEKAVAQMMLNQNLRDG